MDIISQGYAVWVHQYAQIFILHFNALLSDREWVTITLRSNFNIGYFLFMY